MKNKDKGPRIRGFKGPSEKMEFQKKDYEPVTNKKAIIKQGETETILAVEIIGDSDYETDFEGFSFT